VRKADNLPTSCAVVTKSGNLNFLEPSGPVQTCNGTALPLYTLCIYIYIYIYTHTKYTLHRFCIYVYVYIKSLENIVVIDCLYSSLDNIVALIFKII